METLRSRFEFESIARNQRRWTACQFRRAKNWDFMCSDQTKRPPSVPYYGHRRHIYTMVDAYDIENGDLLCKTAP
jgi:hypothetical protein